MATQLNIVATSTGGAGKTFTSVALAQYLRFKPEANVLCLDSDPATPKFTWHKALNVQHVDISKKDMNFDRSRFDDMMELIMEHEGECVIDSGASNFLPLMAYLHNEQGIEVLSNFGTEVIMHAPVVGGDAFAHTLNSLELMLQKLGARVVIWENEFRGPVQHEGRTLYHSKTYRENRGRIIGVVKLQQQDDDLYARTMRTMTENYLTYQEVQESAGLFKAMEKQRILRVQREIFDQLESLGL